MPRSQRLVHLRNSVDSRFLLCLRTEDIRWLTSFTGNSPALLVDTHDAVGHLIVDGRYVERARDEVAQWKTPINVHLLERGESVEGIISRFVGEEVVDVDDSHITAAAFSRLQEQVTLRISPSPLDEARRVKDHEELSTIARAAQIADEAFKELLSGGLIGLTERQIRNRLDHLMKERGADDVGFETIVATGANGARPHHEPTDTLVEDGHMVVLDFGAELNGYRSDMTRTVRVGNVGAELLSMFAIVEEAQATGVHAVKAGVVGSEIDRAVREVFAREGVEHEYVHGTGHGIGLYIHEFPILSPTCSAVLKVNEVVTVEPGLYRKGVGGVRIEDLVIVGDNSCHTLTNTPKDLLCPRSLPTI